MIINLRGTNGSGKSTVVTRVMALYPERRPIMREGRRRPSGYILSGVPEHSALFIPGHYEIACGGCDTLRTVDEVYAMVKAQAFSSPPLDVLYEGIMVADDITRVVALDRDLRHSSAIYGIEPDDDHRVHVIRLSTPIEVSLAAVRDRRKQAGNEKPLNEKNTRGRHDAHVRMAGRLRAAGVAVEELGREEAYRRVCALLRLNPGTS